MCALCFREGRRDRSDDLHCQRGRSVQHQLQRHRGATTDTPGLHEADGEFVDDELPLIPKGRIAKPLDIANAVLYLVSEASDYVTGQILAPNGGRRMLV